MGAAETCCPICASLGPDLIASIGAIAQARDLEKDEPVIYEGTPSSGFFLVVSGRIRVFRSSAGGRETSLLVAERGDTFGEHAVLGGAESFQESAVAVTKSRIVHVPKSEFLALVPRSPELAASLLRLLSRSVARLSTVVERVALMSARDRVVRYLLDLETNGRGGQPIPFPVRKKEIAQQLGIAPETLSRALRELGRSPSLRITSRDVTIVDRRQLERTLPS